jgi:hypothetical protein
MKKMMVFEVSSYYLKNKIHELYPKDFERIDQFIAELKSYNEKLNNCGFEYTKHDITLIILVENKFPQIYDLFIQPKNKSIEVSKGILKPNFEEFCKGLICEHNIRLSLGHMFFGKA